MPGIADNLRRPVWDTDTAAAALTIGALVFLFFVRRGFRGVVVSVGA